MAERQPGVASFLVAAAIAVAAAGFTVFAALLKLHLLYYETTGYAVAGLVAALGFGLVVSRALTDPGRPAPSSDEGPDRLLQMRSLGLGASLLVASVVTGAHLQFRQPEVDVAAVFYGLSLGCAIVFSILLIRRIRPPRPAPPVEETIEAIFGEALEPAHIEILREQVEAGELDVELLMNAGYDEIARILAARGHAMPGERQEFDRHLERRRQRRENRGPGPGRPSQGPRPPDRTPGRQQRGMR